MDQVQDALSLLCSAIPSWNTRLDKLNGQIAERQLELARLTEDRPPTARSMRNKGSTESLRLKNRDENPLDPADGHPNSTNTPCAAAGWRPNSSEAVRSRADGAATPPPPKADSNPRASPHALARQSSQPTPPAQARTAAPNIKKRKTESLASGESLVPKYRTRSMIIVYYDSAVQTAFEELVKFVSGSRNAMRKGKMAAKMAEMRRAAELEVEGEDDADGNSAGALLAPGSNLYAAHRKVAAGMEGGSLPNVFGPGAPMPKLRYTSARQAYQPKDPNNPDETGSGMHLGMLRGYRRNEDNAPSIFDELDKGLEWCQSRCEHAAHQFLREGECSTEIESIKKRLLEVKDAGLKELKRLGEVKSTKVTTRDSSETKPRQAKPVYLRRDFSAPKLEVDDSAMEVDDDEGVDDLEPPKLMFKRSRDIGY